MRWLVWSECTSQGPRSLTGQGSTPAPHTHREGDQGPRRDLIPWHTIAGTLTSWSLVLNLLGTPSPRGTATRDPTPLWQNSNSGSRQTNLGRGGEV